ncbi:hypothetical protein ACFYWA_05860 [Streptomyces sp. NPDC003283]|uniref:hypothetical protein n=1 Tax=Streptomyces sp. NPDC003283 TaxID=3364681 RepID=UPI0036B0A0ED
MRSATADHRCLKTNVLAVAAVHSVDPARWQEAFEILMGRFARVEPWRQVRELVLGAVVGPAAQELLVDRRAGRAALGVADRQRQHRRVQVTEPAGGLDVRTRRPSR